MSDAGGDDAGGDDAGADDAGRPVLRVVRGNPSAEELAAVVAVLAARETPPAPGPAAPSRWASRAPGLRRPLSPGPGAWRASALPGAP